MEDLNPCWHHSMTHAVGFCFTFTRCPTDIRAVSTAETDDGSRHRSCFQKFRHSVGLDHAGVERIQEACRATLELIIGMREYLATPRCCLLLPSGLMAANFEPQTGHSHDLWVFPHSFLRLGWLRKLLVLPESFAVPSFYPAFALSTPRHALYQLELMAILCVLMIVPAFLRMAHVFEISRQLGPLVRSVLNMTQGKAAVRQQPSLHISFHLNMTNVYAACSYRLWMWYRHCRVLGGVLGKGYRWCCNLPPSHCSLFRHSLLPHSSLWYPLPLPLRCFSTDVDEYSDLYSTSFTLYSASLGDFSFDPFLNPVIEEEWRSVLGHVLMVLFTATSHIILLNLLIAIMGSTYERFKDDSEIEYRVGRGK